MRFVLGHAARASKQILYGLCVVAWTHSCLRSTLILLPLSLCASRLPAPAPFTSALHKDSKPGLSICRMHLASLVLKRCLGCQWLCPDKSPQQRDAENQKVKFEKKRKTKVEIMSTTQFDRPHRIHIPLDAQHIHLCGVAPPQVNAIDPESDLVRFEIHLRAGPRSS